MKNSSLIVRYITFLVLISIFACSNNQDYALVYERYAHAQQTMSVNLNKETQHTLNADDQLIPRLDSLEVGGLKWPVLDGERVYAIPRSSEYFFEVELKQGTIQRSHKIKGFGPGEYQSIQYYRYAKDHHLVIDLSQSKLITYNDKLEMIEEAHIKMNQRSLGFWYHDRTLYFSTDTSPDHLLIRKNIDNLTEQSFHDRLISVGMATSAYNHALLTTDEQGNIFVLKQALPFLFLYNRDFELMTMVELKGAAIEHLKEKIRASSLVPASVLVNPPVENIPRTGGSVFVSFLFTDIKVFDSRIYLVAFDGKIIELHYDGYRLTNANVSRFIKQDGREYASQYIAVNDDYMVISSQFESAMIRIRKDELSRRIGF